MSEWNKVSSWDEWLAAWEANWWGPRSIEHASGLLYLLPGIVKYPEEAWDQYSGGINLDKSRSTEKKCRNYLSALYLAMNLATNEEESTIARYGQRAVLILLRWIGGSLKHERMPQILLKRPEVGFTREYWQDPLYRILAVRMLQYFSHPRAYAIDNGLYVEVVHLWRKTLIHGEDDRQKGASKLMPCHIEAFDWPDCCIEPYKTMFLQTLVLDTQTRFGETVLRFDLQEHFPELMNDYFKMLCDCRDARLFMDNECYRRKPRKNWPRVSESHLSAIKAEIYRLGVSLGRSRSVIEHAGYFPAAAQQRLI